MKITHFL